MSHFSPQEDMPDVAVLTLSKGYVVRSITVGSEKSLGKVVQFVGNQNLLIHVERTFRFIKEEVVEAYQIHGVWSACREDLHQH